MLGMPAALAALAVMSYYPGFVAGAGTVLDAWQVAAAADAGARFAVSPGFDPDVVDACQNRSLPVLPGAVTATEIQWVRRAGLRACKFFPAEAAGGLRARHGFRAAGPARTRAPVRSEVISGSCPADVACLRIPHG
jgi:2-dehydro-3-deoxyphosphogluconate aldolase/(4S)-4-hydroxy-2-oxoglutarate aldolase